MERVIRWSRLAVFYCCFICLFSSGYLWAQEEDATEDVAADAAAEVIHVEGTASVVPAEGGEAVALEEGTVLEAGDKIQTGSDGNVEISFDENQKNVVKVAKETAVTLKMDADEKLEMVKGEVFASIGDLPAGEAFEIRTPTAVSGARGTEWTTKIDGEETSVESFEDSAYVKSFDEGGQILGEAVSISPGYATSVRKFQPPAAARMIPAQRKMEWQGWKGQVRSHAQKASARRQTPGWHKPLPGRPTPSGRLGKGAGSGRGKGMFDSRPGQAQDSRNKGGREGDFLDSRNRHGAAELSSGPRDKGKEGERQGSQQPGAGMRAGFSSDAKADKSSRGDRLMTPDQRDSQGALQKSEQKMDRQRDEEMKKGEQDSAQKQKPDQKKQGQGDGGPGANAGQQKPFQPKPNSPGGRPAPAGGARPAPVRR